LGQFLYCAGTNVPADVGLGSDLFAEIEKLVSSKTVVLGNAAPVDIDHFRPFFPGTNAVHPVIGIGETAAGPAEVGDSNFF
jgi:hypothetical protein